MKLMFASCCNTLVVPDKRPYHRRHCDCNKSAIWWRDPNRGSLTIFSDKVDNVSVIGLHNGLLSHPLDLPWVRKDDIQNILQNTPDNYYFKQFESLVIRLRPGVSSDVRFTNDDRQLPLPNWHHEDDI